MNRDRSVFVAIAIVCALSAGPAAAQTQRAPAARPQTTAAQSAFPLEDYRIGPEDVLDISVWKNTDLTRTVVVRPDGCISLPLLNDIAAANLTPNELRDVLVKGYAQYVNEAEVSVIVREIHSFKISVEGMVRNSGRFEVRSRITVLDALALAGGLTEFAKRDRITVYRTEGTRVQRLGFDYSNMLDSNSEQNFVLHPGDIVVVP